MIVKIWPIKAQYKGAGKVGGFEGLKNALDYNADEAKTFSEIHYEEPVSRNYLTDISEDSAINQTEDFSRVLAYASNDDKIKGKYGSGYLCDPENAAEDFRITHNQIKSMQGKSESDSKGNIAYHMVQSFPEELDISDEEVHQCGLELVQRLSKYQAVVYSHVHPVVDEDGVYHGKCKHNHIIFNAYKHPNMIDPNFPNQVKYHDCKETYAQLQIWNDEIAIEHGLPIIRNPDYERTYSWFENQAVSAGTSWKEKIRIDIEDARRCTRNWTEFKREMGKKGYRIKDQTRHVTYLAPDGKHKSRGNSLGRNYTKEGLETYWKMRDRAALEAKAETLKNPVQSIEKINQTFPGKLYASIPLGTKGHAGQQSYKLPLETRNLQPESLYSYFSAESFYDIYNEKEQPVAATTGKEIIEYMLRVKEHEKELWWEEDQMRRKRENEQAKERARKHEEQFYSYQEFLNSKTKQAYRVGRYDQHGRRRSDMECIFVLAVVVLNKEDGLWMPDKVPPGKANELSFGPTNRKIQNMLDSIQIAREEQVSTPEEIDTRLDTIGAENSRAKASLRKNTQVKNKMDTLAEAIQEYEETKSVIEKLSTISDAAEKEKFHTEHESELRKYSSAKAVMYRYKVKEPKQIVDFNKRYAEVQKNIRVAEKRVDETSEQYRRLKKLQYNTKLAQNTQYCYGPEYTSDRGIDAVERQIQTVEQGTSFEQENERAQKYKRKEEKNK